MKGFNCEYCGFINELVEEKIAILKRNKDFNRNYSNLFNKIEKFEKSLSEQQMKKFDEILHLFFKTEEYYLAFTYSLGVKYGDELKKI